MTVWKWKCDDKQNSKSEHKHWSLLFIESRCTSTVTSCLNKGTIHPHEEQASAFGSYPVLTQHLV